MRTSCSPPASAARPEWGSGAVCIKEIPALDAPSRVRIDSVRSGPGAQRAWHRHPDGQVLHITEMANLVQHRGCPVGAVHVGIATQIASGQWHWHGAPATRRMTHLTDREVAEEDAAAGRGPRAIDTRATLLLPGRSLSSDLHAVLSHHGCPSASTDAPTSTAHDKR